MSKVQPNTSPPTVSSLDENDQSAPSWMKSFQAADGRSEPEASLQSIGGVPVAEPVSIVASPDFTMVEQKQSKAILWASLGSFVWLAVVVGSIYVQYRLGRFHQLDALNIASLAAGAFTPVTAFWLAALSVLRSGPLVAERARIEQVIASLVQPLEIAQAHSIALHGKVSAQVQALDDVAGNLETRIEAMTPTLDAHITRLSEVSQRLDTARELANASAQTLRTVVSEVGKLANDVGNRLPEVIGTVSHVSTEAALHSQHVEQATQNLIAVITQASEKVAGLLPKVLEATAQTDKLGAGLGVRLGALTEQSQKTSAMLDQTSEKAADVLEASRIWVSEQIAAIELSLTKMERDGLGKLEAMAAEIRALDRESGSKLTDSLASLTVGLHRTEADMRERLTSLKDEWSELLSSADQIGTSIGMKLLDAMARARGVSNEALVAAKDASDSIIQSAEASLGKTKEHAEAVGAGAIAALEARADRLAGLAADAHGHALAVSAALKVEANEDLSKLSAKIIESLQAYSIDIAKVFAVEVPDDDWKAYLSGDRSLFARRMVKLSDRTTETKVAERFRTDGEFREATVRYLRGFESLLKLGLNGEQGQALGITLLSSDLGKLYVLLGKATERL